MNIEATTEQNRNQFHELHHPILIIVRGVPGSGKSYLAAALQESLGKENVVTLDPDSIDQTSKEYSDFSKALTTEGVDTKLHPYRFSRSKAYEAIVAHKIIIWNQPFIDFEGFRKTIDRLQTYAAEHTTQLPALVVEVEVSEAIAKKRVMSRKEQGGHGPAEDIFAYFISQYKSFSEKGYTTVIVQGEDDVAVSVSAVKNALRKLQER